MKSYFKSSSRFHTEIRGIAMEINGFITLQAALCKSCFDLMANKTKSLANSPSIKFASIKTEESLLLFIKNAKELLILSYESFVNKSKPQLIGGVKY